jgi:hypothetical protein
MNTDVVVQQQTGGVKYAPQVLIKKDRPAAGQFAVRPRGIILHGSRSDQAGRPTHQEFLGTAAYQGTNPGDLGWNATIGNDEIAIHLEANEWGYNAFSASKVYLAVEFAQPTVNDPISDGQVRAFCWWMRKYVLARWPDLSLHFPTHSDVEHTGEIGHAPSGKTDVFPYNDPRAAELQNRILTRLRDSSWTI